MRFSRMKSPLGLGAVVSLLFLVSTACTMTVPEELADSPTILGSQKRDSPYSDVALGIVLSDLSKFTIRELAANQSINWGMGGTDPKTVRNGVTNVLKPRFKSVEYLDRLDDAGSRRVDMTVEMDVGATIGMMSFQTTSVEVRGVFRDIAGKEIDRMSGAGAATISYPNTGTKFYDAYTEALSQFTAGINASAKLTQAVAPTLALAREGGGAKTLPLLGQSRFPMEPVAVSFAKGPTRPDDIAVIIGNADYATRGRDIPDVVPAYADAEGFKHYALNRLGILEGNIIHLRDAGQAELISVFGSERNHRGRIFNWVQPGVSNVWVYYAGHGAPAGREGTAYLVPTDADAATVELNGYPLDLLYGNLGKVPARKVTVVLEACFSGTSQAGSVIAAASGIHIKPKAARIPPNVTVIAAGAADQIASWEKDKSGSLFTNYFLKGMSGEADAAPYGNGNGRVGWPELKRYLKRTLTYFARRYYGRDQSAMIVVGQQ